MPSRVSVVIPCNHTLEDLKILITQLAEGLRVPDEVIVVRSEITLEERKTSTLIETSTTELIKTLAIKKIDLRFINIKQCYPGDARNIGVAHSSGDLIGFLDVKTLPTIGWLKEACEMLEDESSDGVWGSRLYLANSLLSSAIRDVIYGRKPVLSVAGTVVRRRCLMSIGEMISWTPAGEDGDWIHRIEAHRKKMIKLNSHNISYAGLQAKPLGFFVRKWWRYYHYSRMLPVNNRDRWLVHILGYVSLLFLAFNWNYQISELVFGYPIIVPHITKLALVGGLIFYVLIRGIYLPIKRGVPIIALLPFRFLYLLIITTILDLVKVVALLKPVK